MSMLERLREEYLEIQKVSPGADAHYVHQWALQHPQSAWHEYLEWDDAKCGLEWRLQQIRQVVCRFKVVAAQGPSEIEFRQFTTIPAENAEDARKRLTIPTIDILADPLRRRQKILELLVAAYGELRNHPQLTELDGIRKQLERLIQKYQKEVEEFSSRT